MYALFMPFRVGKWLVVLAVVVATGSHWFLLQSVAWVGMTVEFSRTEALATALEKTFSGQNPCGLCKLVQEGQKTENRPEFQISKTKLDLFCERAPVLADESLPFTQPVPTLLQLTLHPEAPPTPPPRVA